MRRRRIRQYPRGAYGAWYFPNGIDGVAVDLGRNESESEADRRAREHYEAFGEPTAVFKSVPRLMDIPRCEITKRYGDA